MNNCPTFASLAYENKKKKTRREKFLEEMEQVIPWADLLKIVRKHYPILRIEEELGNNAKYAGLGAYYNLAR